MNVKRTYSVTDHNDDFETYVKVVDVKGLKRVFPMDHVTEVLVSPFEGGPYAEVKVKFSIGVRRNDANFIVDAENLEVLEKELKKFRGKDLFFYKGKPSDLWYEQDKVTLPDAVVIGNQLSIFAENGMKQFYLDGIDSITLKDGKMVIRHYENGKNVDDTFFSEDAYMPVIAAYQAYKKRSTKKKEK